MKIIVTGAAGFIGSNLVGQLLSEGHFVVGIDDFSYGRRGNIEIALCHQNFKFKCGNLCDLNIYNDLDGDVLVHLASQKIPRYTNAYKTLDENHIMLKNAITFCVRNKVKLIFASTSDVYGKNTNLPFHENSDLVMGPTNVKRWSYSLSKIFSEQYIIANHDQFGLDYTIMRFFGSFGPNQNITWWGGPQAVFIQNIIDGLPIELHGDGLQTRTFTYIQDTIQGIVKCIFHEKAKNEIFNIASEPNEEVSIHELALIICELMSKNHNNTEIKYVPYSTFGNYEDVRRRVPSIEKIKQMLGYCPKFKLREGLMETIDWQINFNKKIKT